MTTTSVEFELREATVPVTSHTCRHCGYIWVELTTTPINARIWHGICPRCRALDRPDHDDD